MTQVAARTTGGAILLDGVQLRDETVAKIKTTIDKAGKPAICLATVLVGDDAPSHIYVKSKHQKAQEAGMVSRGTICRQTRRKHKLNKPLLLWSPTSKFTESWCNCHCRNISTLKQC
ncbi:bifunctional protein Fol [Acidimicrobiaceae bacterium]|nr:bifunctional protein Fol [Acidimicrobiaceae bacterium]